MELLLRTVISIELTISEFSVSRHATDKPDPDLLLRLESDDAEADLSLRLQISTESILTVFIDNRLETDEDELDWLSSLETYDIGLRSAVITMELTL